eukprot:15157526-Ditylum_brightwellii.AAC.1
MGSGARMDWVVCWTDSLLERKMLVLIGMGDVNKAVSKESSWCWSVAYALRTCLLSTEVSFRSCNELCKMSLRAVHT